MDKEFTSFVHGFVKQYKKDIFKDVSKCKSLLLDHAKGEYKNEIRLLLQSLELGCYATIMNSNDLNITRMSLIKQLQDEYYISENIAISLIDMLLMVLRNYKAEQIKLTNQIKTNIANNHRNTSNQNQFVKQDEKEIDTTDAIRVIGSMVSTKELSVERFNEKVKNNYESIFIEYQKIMRENNLECRYYRRNDSLANHIFFEFSFVKKFHNCYNANYCISKAKNDSVETRWYFVTNDYNADKEFINEKHLYGTDVLTKERIMNELNLFTEKILSIIKKRHN